MSTPNTHYGAERIGRMLVGVDSIYFLGIGGISMSSLAMMTQRRGLAVSGYDRTQTALTQRLIQAGISVYYEADKAHLDGVGAVVYTVAISSDHPEYVEAQRRGLPLISRADYLGYLMVDYRDRIGMAGSHGKSTATCMCARIFMSAEADPTVLSGAAMRSMGGAFLLGGKDTMVFEACEYKDSFLDFNPTVSVLLNTDLDHVDYFHSLDQLKASYAAFANRAGRAGKVIYNADDEQTVQALAECIPERVSFGWKCAADYMAQNVTVERGHAAFDLFCRGEHMGHVALRVPGEHNVYNALAAAAAAHECGVRAEDIVAGLQAFEGAERRMEYKGQINGAAVYDDYAHHPTEVAATLREARLLGQGKLICAFQPHTYSRTAALFDDYISALRVADAVIVAPIYAARETDDCGVSAASLAAAVGERAVAAADEDEVIAQLCAQALPGDTVVVMGAGNIDRIFGRLPLLSNDAK